MKTIKIGRGTNNDVVINDGVVSTFHAVITVSDFGEISIEDLNSKNGTFVNGQRITKTVLTPSSTVLLGNHSIDWKQIIQNSKNHQIKASITFPDDVVEKKTIGRNPMSQIRYSFNDVSDKHAYICKKSNGDVVIIDNNSTNGTYVNGNKITSPYVLKRGDYIAISNKHPLNWEAVYPAKSKINFKLIVSIAASIVLLAGVLISQPWTSWNRDWSDVYAEHKNDVALIYVEHAYLATVQGMPLSAYLNGNTELDCCYLDKEGKLRSGLVGGSGTGFFISSDGKMLTNRHVVTDDVKKNVENIKGIIQYILVQNNLTELAAYLEVNYKMVTLGIIQNDTYIGNKSDLIPCTVLKVSDNPELDVALIQTNSKSIPTGSTYLDLSKATPTEQLKLGYGVCTIGFPQSFTVGGTSVGLEANNQSGEITQERGVYEYGHNMTSTHGASGSPVYDKKGRFSGIIVSGFEGGYNQAVHPAPILEFLEKKY